MKIFYEYLAVEADGAAILARHGWPMIVVRSRKKQEYLEALHQSDLVVGMTPSEGSHASLVEIRHFLHYFQRLVQTEIQSDIDFVRRKAKNSGGMMVNAYNSGAPMPTKCYYTIFLQLYFYLGIAKVRGHQGQAVSGGQNAPFTKLFSHIFNNLFG